LNNNWEEDMFKRKTTGSRGAIGAAVALSAILVGGAVSAKDITMGTTSPTSSHFTISVAMSKAIETGMEGATVNVIETGASVSALPPPTFLSRPETEPASSKAMQFPTRLHFIPTVPRSCCLP
jgi:hypothetical protein